MKKQSAFLIALFLIPVLSYCQANDKIANDAFMLTAMVNKFHVEPRALDRSFSADVFKTMLQRADPEKIFFTNNDIDKLSVYSAAINIEIKSRKTTYLNFFTNIYRMRLKQADSLVNIIDKKAFEFNSPGKLTVAEDTTYPVSLLAMQQKIYKKIKLNILIELVENMPDNFKSFSQLKQRNYLDSAEASLHKKVTSAFKRRINQVLLNSYGINQYVGNIYCETIANCFDPHTEFFPPEKKENFESEVGKQPFIFGFTIKANKNGGVIIDKLEPGSPAFKGGKLNKGDKFITLQWEGGQPVDVSDISVEELSALIDESNHKKAFFTMKKLDGTITHVSLQKEQLSGGDDSRVKSFILKGKSTIGYIYLPAFYEDWDFSNEGLNGCANDVGREIIKLKKESINGLILDLRYNGGGSAEEATKLAGIFIDAGPVEQVKDRGAKIYTLKDVDRGTIYDGPLVILVNGYSASASELVAGTLQDYNRAVIVGSATYGKATAQVIFPMDTTVSLATFANKQTDNYIKITISKLYRVNGTTAQFSGVKPDIILPDILDAYITKESDDPFALRPNTIPANKYYEPYQPLPLESLAAAIQTETDTSKYFNAIKSIIAYSKKQKGEKDFSLNLKDAMANMDPMLREKEVILNANPVSKNFSVQNEPYEEVRLHTDAYLKELNDDFSKQIASDAYINIAYDVLTKLKTQ